MEQNLNPKTTALDNQSDSQLWIYKGQIVLALKLGNDDGHEQY